MTDALELPPVLDIAAVPGLLEAFIARRGHTLAVEAGAVQRLGAQCLQVLLAARAAWAADGVALGFKNMSEDFLATLALLGVAPAELAHGGAMAGHGLKSKELAA